MYNKTYKLLGLILLLILSFIYTNKVFSLVKEKDPLYIKIKEYKKKNDVLPTNGIINDDTISIGSAGTIINVNASYEKMKKENKFNKNRIVYENKLPDITINNNYSYFIEKGNPSKKEVALIFEGNDIKKILYVYNLSIKNNIIINFFIDGKSLIKNIDDYMTIKYPIYNLGYNNKYDLKTINKTNELIETISNNKSTYCLNENKIIEDLKLCNKNKMYSISPAIINPTVADIKKNLSNGLIIEYNVDEFDINKFNYIINVIKSRNYNITSLDKLLSE